MASEFETPIISGGQAGLAMSYCLSQQDRSHLILEQSSQIVSAWRDKSWENGRPER
jgi:putative flavoprotein involved in K+ transport